MVAIVITVVIITIISLSCAQTYVIARLLVPMFVRQVNRGKIHPRKSKQRKSIFGKRPQ